MIAALGFFWKFKCMETEMKKNFYFGKYFSKGKLKNSSIVNFIKIKYSIPKSSTSSKFQNLEKNLLK